MLTSAGFTGALRSGPSTPEAWAHENEGIRQFLDGGPRRRVHLRRVAPSAIWLYASSTLNVVCPSPTIDYGVGGSRLEVAEGLLRWDVITTWAKQDRVRFSILRNTGSP